MLAKMRISRDAGPGCAALWSKPDAAGGVTSFQDRLPPRLLIDIPAYRLCDAAFEVFFGIPAQLALELGGIDGVTAVVARAVGDERDQLAPRSDSAWRQ